MCFFCKGEMKEDLTTHVVELDEMVIVVKKVPCKKCEQCGQVTFGLEVAKRLEQIVDGLENSLTEVAIVKYSDKIA